MQMIAGVFQANMIAAMHMTVIDPLFSRTALGVAAGDGQTLGGAGKEPH